MGSSISRFLPIYDQAKRLGNPKIPFNVCPPYLRSSNAYPNHGLTILSHSGFGTITVKRSGDTSFGYLMNPSRFDTGYIIMVEYDRNANEPGCVENEILHFQQGMDLRYFNQTILGALEISSYITRVSFKTMLGKPYVHVKSTSSLEDIHYNYIPSTINLPRVPISEIIRLPQEFISYHSDGEVILYNGDLYWFNHYETFPDPWVVTSDDLLQEFHNLSEISSPFILRPSFVVTDRNSSGMFRGYLQPFQPAGSFFDLYQRLGTDEDILRRGILDTVWSYDFGFFNPVLPHSLGLPLSTLKIDWPVKHVWCIEIASAVHAMHDARNFSGNLRLQYALLCRDGHARLINISPWSGYNLYYAPPEVDSGLDLETTGPRDIFSLGLMLWALTEEVAEFDRQSVTDIPTLSWKEGDNCAPRWFRDLVEGCIERDPNDRPSVEIVCEILTKYRY